MTVLPRKGTQWNTTGGFVVSLRRTWAKTLNTTESDRKAIMAVRMRIGSDLSASRSARGPIKVARRPMMVEWRSKKREGRVDSL